MNTTEAAANRSAESVRVVPVSKVGLFALVAVLTLLWGTNWALFPLAVREISVWTFRAVCLLGAGGILLGVAYLQGVSLRIESHEWKPLVAASVAYMVTWNICSTYAAVLLPSGQAALLAFTMPVWSTLISWGAFGDKPDGRQVGAVLLAALGIGLVAFRAGQSTAGSVLGLTFGVLCAVGWAVGTVILKRSRISMPLIVSTGWQLTLAGVPIALVALALGGEQVSSPSYITLLVVGYITLVPMALGNLVWFSIVNRLPAAVSGLSAVMVPILAMLVGASVLHEPLGLLEFAAMACCAAGMLLVLMRRNLDP